MRSALASPAKIGSALVNESRPFQQHSVRWDTAERWFGPACGQLGNPSRAFVCTKVADDPPNSPPEAVGRRIIRPYSDLRPVLERMIRLGRAPRPLGERINRPPPRPQKRFRADDPPLKSVGSLRRADHPPIRQSQSRPARRACWRAARVSGPVAEVGEARRSPEWGQVADGRRRAVAPVRPFEPQPRETAPL
jgi:hypothetical protein